MTRKSRELRHEGGELLGMGVEVLVVTSAERDAVGGVVPQVGAASFRLNVGRVQIGVGSALGELTSPVVQFQHGESAPAAGGLRGCRAQRR